MLQPEQADVIQTSVGTSWLWRPARCVLVTRVNGVLTAQAGAAMEAAMLKLVAEDGRYEGFHDWERMRDYDTEARIRLTSAARVVFKRTEGIHFLLRSKVVMFGVQMANMALGNLRVHRTRESFEAALDEALARYPSR